MCGFGVSNITRLESVNKFCQKRGPDLTNSKIVNGVELLHNLLHITGNITPQPFIRNDIACVFNGEIYNYKSFGSYGSDGECIIDLYEQHGERFTRLLDGEWALCLIDFKNSKLITAVDTFSCKPLWFGANGKNFAVGSYESQVAGLGLRAQKQESNTTNVYSLKYLTLLNSYKNREFDLNQHNTSFDGWLLAFEASIKKRTRNTEQGMFVGLSSGYDSGAIACELEKQKVPFKAYSITNNENPEVMKARLNLMTNSEGYILSEQEFQSCKQELNQNCEDFIYDDGFRNYNIKKDQASMGLSSICRRANKENRKIYFSGQGADEIISDYGFGGKKIYKHSEFGGKFPENLHGFYPWHSFYDGTQIQYLNKEEYVAGHFGIETRYPFLDNDLIQEFLWLDVKLKNSKYKSCLDEYLTRNNFPFERAEKRGFNVVAKGKKMKQAKGSKR